jgi:hypothetical protein
LHQKSSISGQNSAVKLSEKIFMKKNIIKIILLTLFLKIIYFAFALLVSKSEINTGYHTELTKAEFISVFKRNDSYWYQKAAELGYPKITNASDLGYSNGKYFKQSVWALKQALSFCRLFFP